jgi:regulator of replication initiation timing
LESKIKTQQDKLEQLEIKLKNLEEQTKEISKKDGKIKCLMEELDRVRLEKRSAEVRLSELHRDLEQKQRQSTDTKRDVLHVEERFQKVLQLFPSYKATPTKSNVIPLIKPLPPNQMSCLLSSHSHQIKCHSSYQATPTKSNVIPLIKPNFRCSE